MLTQSGDAAILAMKQSVHDELKRAYDGKVHLWNPDMDQILNDFVTSNPLTAEIRDKFNLYDCQLNAVRDAPKSSRIDFLELHYDDFLSACLVHAKAWKSTLGRYVTTMYRKKLLTFVTFTSDIEKVLMRPIKDLDDVRIAMGALEKLREESVT